MITNCANKSAPAALTNSWSAANQIIQSVQRDFEHDVPDFLRKAGIPHLRFEASNALASPIFLLTGATFVTYNPTLHGDDPAHCLYSGPSPCGHSYIMNNTAAIFELLMAEGQRIIVHSSDLASIEKITSIHPNKANVIAIGGDLGTSAFLKNIYRALEDMAEIKPISILRMALYQSFAQMGNGTPFKPLHKECVEEVERAASKRLRFVYNMAAMGYDLLMNKGLEELRVVSLSALAANRATYGLIADAADKHMNELAWRTFYHEAGISTGKPISIYQVNPGITAACDIYHRDAVRNVVCAESIADGFPLDNAVLTGEHPLPALSTAEVAWVAHRLLTTPNGGNPNDGMPNTVRRLLYGGFSPEELKMRFARAVQIDGDTIDVDSNRMFPDHILKQGTRYGALPEKMVPGDYKSISLCPPGQRF